MLRRAAALTASAAARRAGLLQTGAPASAVASTRAASAQAASADEGKQEKKRRGARGALAWGAASPRLLQRAPFLINPSPFSLSHTTDPPLGPDEIEMKGIRLAGVPVYLDSQVRECRERERERGRAGGRAGVCCRPCWVVPTPQAPHP